VSSALDDVMVIGRIVGAFGVHGEVKVELLTDYPERFKGMKNVLLGKDRQPITIDAVRSHKGRILIKLAGIDTPEAVDNLRGDELAVPRSEAIKIPEDHYFLEDVIGCEVVDEVGTPVGQVTDVLRTGSNDVFVVGTGQDAVLIPSIKDAVVKLDLPRRRICVQRWVLESEA
jgi:16S rRNA processing protein RimM